MPQEETEIVGVKYELEGKPAKKQKTEKPEPNSLHQKQQQTPMIKKRDTVERFS